MYRQKNSLTKSRQTSKELSRKLRRNVKLPAIKEMFTGELSQIAEVDYSLVHPDAVSLLKKMPEKDPLKRATIETLVEDDEDELLTLDKLIDLFKLADLEE